MPQRFTLFTLVATALLFTIALPTPHAAAVAGPALSVDVSADRHAISPDIYGMNFPDATLAAELHMSVQRWGGNSTTRYNWQADIANRGSDWYFENVFEGDGQNLPDGSSVNAMIDQGRQHGTQTIITVPLIGWTPRADSSRNHPFNCGFKVSSYGSQQSTDPWDSNCGNGVRSNGTPITGNNPADTSTAINPSFVQSWVSYLVSRYGQAGVRYYNLDNEPGIWSYTHRDVHPAALTYTEIRDRTYQYAAAVKTADPTAQTLGPVQDGWTRYWYASYDSDAQAAADRNANGGTPFVPWYLQQMQAYEQQHGTRILDYLDLHYYPQASGVTLQGAGDTNTQALRLRSTRSLWDPTYADESWINGTEGGPQVRLIPRMREWVAQNYPGTKLAITEYNWGALDHINGALAQADVLGIFGREGVDLATLWAAPDPGEPGAFAFRMFRNYDGKGSAFGETGVRAASANQGTLAIYAARRGLDGALTIVVINKSKTDQTSSIALSGFDPAASALAYRYSAASPSAIVALSSLPVGAGSLSATFPAESITTIAIQPARPLDKKLYLSMLR